MPVSESVPPKGACAGFCSHGRLLERGVPHGVTFRSLGDMKAQAARAEACRAAGVGEPLLLRQRHGTTVLEGTAPFGSGEPPPIGDGWVSFQTGVTLGVFAADCLPIFLWDEESLEAVGVFHSGWRGTAAGMPRAAVEAFSSRGVAPRRLAGFIGPHVGACCYRVGPELEDRFRPGSFLRKPEGLFLDLAAEAAAQLREAGVGADRIEVSADCTSCRSDLYFSFRREKQDRRMLAFIMKPYPPAGRML